jgi:hypothetical protein
MEVSREPGRPGDVCHERGLARVIAGVGRHAQRSRARAGGRTGRRCALRGAAARGNILGEAVKASGHQRTRKAWELAAAAEIWLQMLLILGVRQIGS